jgi:hypothetical protein
VGEREGELGADFCSIVEPTHNRRYGDRKTIGFTLFLGISSWPASARNNAALAAMNLAEARLKSQSSFC